MTAPTFADPTATPPPAGRVVSEFWRYFLASATALVVDAGLYAGLVAAGVPWSAAAAAGFGLGLVTAYLLSVRLVFAHRAVHDRRREFLVFASIGLVGLLLTEALLWLWIERLQVGAFAAKVVTAGVVFCSNFTLRKLLLFTPRADRREGGA